MEIALTPMEFARRARRLYGDKEAVVDGEKRLGPDPGKMNPIDIEIPTLWALSKITPELFPSSPGMVSA